MFEKQELSQIVAFVYDDFPNAGDLMVHRDGGKRRLDMTVLPGREKIRFELFRTDESNWMPVLKSSLSLVDGQWRNDWIVNAAGYLGTGLYADGMFMRNALREVRDALNAHETEEPEVITARKLKKGIKSTGINNHQKSWHKLPGYKWLVNAEEVGGYFNMLIDPSGELMLWLSDEGIEELSDVYDPSKPLADEKAFYTLADPSFPGFDYWEVYLEFDDGGGALNIMTNLEFGFGDFEDGADYHYTDKSQIWRESRWQIGYSLHVELEPEIDADALFGDAKWEYRPGHTDEVYLILSLVEFLLCGGIVWFGNITASVNPQEIKDE